MSGIFNILNIGQNSVMAHQTAVELTGQNVTNASTPGYHRQSVDWVSLDRRSTPYALPPAGASIASVIRSQDELVEAQLRRESGFLGSYTARNRYLGQMESILVVDGRMTLSESVDSFFNSASNLATRPDSMDVRRDVLSKAELLGDDFRDARLRLVNMRENIRDEVGSVVEEINALAEELSVLNGQVVRAESTGTVAAELRDQQDRVCDRLSELSGCRIFRNENGVVNVVLGPGTTLVDARNAKTLALNVDPATQVMSIDVTDPNGASHTATLRQTDGLLGGLIDLDANDLRGGIAELDTIAFNFVQEVNSLHNTGFALDATDGRNLFEPIALVDGASGLITLSSDVDGQPANLAASFDAAGVPGDNQIALALSEMRYTTIAGLANQTFNGSLDSYSVQLGMNVRDHQLRMQSLDGSVTSLTNLKEQVSGVSTDEEMVNLLKYQRGYEAAAKIVKVADELLEVVLSLK